MDAKKILRGLVIAVSAYLLAICLLFLASAIVFTSLVANPDKIKYVLAGSGVYKDIPGVLYENIQNENKEQRSDIDLGDPQIKQAALSSFDSQFFQTNAEKAINGIYPWLNGEVSQPEFVIDATGAKNKFIEEVVATETAKARNLPECSFQQLRQMDPGSINIFNLECRPPGVNIAQVAQQAETELKNNPEFLGEAKLDAKDIKNENGEPAFSPNSEVPESFQLARNAPVALTILAILLAAAVYLISTDKKKGLSKIAKVLAGAGIVTLLAPIFIKFISGNILPTAAEDKAVSEIVAPIVQSFNSAAASIYYLVGGIMLAAGVLLLLAIYKNIFKLPEAEPKK
jgi:hypothetical protein